MKMTCKTLRCIFALTLLLFISCSKEETILENNSVKSSEAIKTGNVECINGILHFKSTEDIYSLIDSLNQLPEEEIFQWEAEMGFYSQRQRNYEIYQKLNQAEDSIEYEQIIAENKNLIRIYDEMPFIQEDFYSKIANLDGLFVVDSIPHKVKNGKVACAIDGDINKLSDVFNPQLKSNTLSYLNKVVLVKTYRGESMTEVDGYITQQHIESIISKQPLKFYSFINLSYAQTYNPILKSWCMRTDISHTVRGYLLYPYRGYTKKVGLKMHLNSAKKNYFQCLFYGMIPNEEKDTNRKIQYDYMVRDYDQWASYNPGFAKFYPLIKLPNDTEFQINPVALLASEFDYNLKWTAEINGKKINSETNIKSKEGVIRFHPDTPEKAQLNWVGIESWKIGFEESEGDSLTWPIHYLES